MASSKKERDYIRHYVLGTHDRENEGRFEQRLLTDAQLLQELSMIENELLHEYVSGVLSEPERKAFESRVLIGPKAQGRVQFFRALKNQLQDLNLDESYNHLPQSWKRVLPSFLRGESPVLRISLATASVLLVFGIAFIVKDNWSTKRREDVVFAVTLSRGVLRDLGDGEINLIEIPSSIDLVELRLPVGTNVAKDYRVLLITDEGEEKFAQNHLLAESTPTGGVIKLRVPTTILARGDYRVRVQVRTDIGSFEDLITYSVRVIRH
jgi:hypothetical protein